MHGAPRVVAIVAIIAVVIGLAAMCVCFYPVVFFSSTTDVVAAEDDRILESQCAHSVGEVVGKKQPVPVVAAIQAELPCPQRPGPITMTGRKNQTSWCAPSVGELETKRLAHVAIRPDEGTRVQRGKEQTAREVLGLHSRGFRSDGDRSRVLASADIYKTGVYPEFLPDENMALLLYQLCASCPDRDISGLGQARYVETRVDPVVLGDRRGEPLPRWQGQELAAEARRRIASTPYGEFQSPTPRDIRRLPQTEMPPDDPPLPPVSAVGHHRSDAQNVHDHSVTCAVRKSIEELKSRHGTPTSAETDRAVEIVRNEVLTSDDEARGDALEVLEQLNSSIHGTFSCSELEVLGMALKEIETRGDSAERGNLLDMLVKQLATGKERGVVVCSSGKISRIIGSFDGTGTFEEGAVPMWALREEIGTLAGKIREEYPGDEERAGAELSRKCREQYVSRMGMCEDILMPMVQEYVDAM